MVADSPQTLYPGAVSALSRRGDLLDVDVERSVWTRGGRPLGGTLVRFGFAGVFLALGLAIAEPVTRIVFIAFGMGVLLLLQPIMDRRLEAQGAAIARSDRSGASRWLAQLGKQRIVSLFAPHAWVALQRGRLHLILGNGRAAAKSLADCARISGHADLPALVSAQAHGLLLAGDRKEARPLLAALEGKNLLSPRDRLDLGIALLEEPGRANPARAHLEAAREQLGGHPRVLAGLALALARSDTPAEALPLLDAAQLAEDAETDELAAELIKRAKKTLRPAIEAAEKRERRARVAAEQSGRASTPAEPRAAAKRREKKERRKERREKRRDADKDRDVSAKDREAAAARKRDEAAAKEREAAAAKEREAAAAKEREAAAAKQRDEAAAKEREAVLAKEREDAAVRRRVEEEAAAKRRAEEAAATAKRRADEAAAAAKRRAEEEAAAAKRREAAAGPTPTFMAPPMPTGPTATAATPAAATPAAATPPVATPPRVPAPPKIAPPPVVAPPKVATPPAPAIDASGWDDLLGDAPPPPTPTTEPKKP